MKRADSALPPRVAGGSEWAGASRRARALAAAGAVLLALLTAVLVSLAWKRVGPPRSRASAVEVKLIAAPASGAQRATRPGSSSSAR